MRPRASLKGWTVPRGLSLLCVVMLSPLWSAGRHDEEREDAGRGWRRVSARLRDRPSRRDPSASSRTASARCSSGRVRRTRRGSSRLGRTRERGAEDQVAPGEHEPCRCSCVPWSELLYKLTDRGLHLLDVRACELVEVAVRRIVADARDPSKLFRPCLGIDADLLQLIDQQAGLLGCPRWRLDADGRRLPCADASKLLLEDGAEEHCRWNVVALATLTFVEKFLRLRKVVAGEGRIDLHEKGLEEAVLI